MQVLKLIGVDWKDRRLIAALYVGQKASVTVNREDSEPSLIGRDVRQGCLISYAKAIERDALLWKM